MNQSVTVFKDGGKNNYAKCGSWTYSLDKMQKKDNVFLNTMSGTSMAQDMAKFARKKKGVPRKAAQTKVPRSAGGRVTKKRSTGRTAAAFIEESVPEPTVGKVQDRIAALRRIDMNLFDRLVSAGTHGQRDVICPASGDKVYFPFLYEILKEYEDKVGEHIAKWSSPEDWVDLQQYKSTRVLASTIDEALVAEILDSQTIIKPCCKRIAVYTAFNTEFYADQMDLDIPETTSFEMLNVRCSSCGRPIAHFTQVVDDMLRSGEYVMEEILNYLNIRNICCRKNFVVPPVYSGYTERKEYLMTPEELKFEEQKVSDNTEVYTFDWSKITEDAYNEYMESLDAYQQKGISVSVIPRSEYANMDTRHVAAGKFFTGVAPHVITSMIPDN